MNEELKNPQKIKGKFKSEITVGGTKNYEDLINKPIINEVELVGELSLEDLGIDQDFLKTETDPVFSASPSANITNEDITNWDNKSEFSGSYNDLTDKPNIPSKTSDLTNDSNFVSDSSYVHTDNNYTTSEKTKLANLENYDDTEIKSDISDLETNKADKSTTYTKTEVDNLIPDVSNFITNSVDDLLNYYLKTETYTKTEVNTLIGAIQTVSFEIVQELPSTGESNIIYLVPRSTSETDNVYDEYIYVSNDWEKIGSTDIDLSDYVTTSDLNTVLADYTTTANLTTLLAGKQDTLTFDSTPTENSNNPVTSNGIYEALQNAGGGGGLFEKITMNDTSQAIEYYLASKMLSEDGYTFSSNVPSTYKKKKFYAVEGNFKMLSIGSTTNQSPSFNTLSNYGPVLLEVNISGKDNVPTTNFGLSVIYFPVQESTGSTGISAMRMSLRKAFFNKINTTWVNQSCMVFDSLYTSTDTATLTDNRNVVKFENLLQLGDLPKLTSYKTPNNNYQLIQKQYVDTQTGTLSNLTTTDKTSLVNAINEINSGGGSATDVQINGTSIVSDDVANILTNTAYDSSTNKIATMSDLPSISGKEDTTNKVTSLSSSSTDTQYPSAKCVYDTVENLQEKVDVVTSSTSTYTIASLTGNKSYKLGEITSLTITATTTFDEETVIYFDSGSTGTSISIPDTLTNLGDVPTLTIASNVSTGTCDTNKSYIVAVLNDIAVWRKY